MLPGRPQVFRDPVHGDIEYERGPFQRLVRTIINSEPFQRLRGIRQNGVMNLVFHGAEHSRFTHSMGVAWLARQMFDAAVRNSEEPLVDEEREATILAALLHDVGHGPFSHLLEEILTKEVFDHEELTLRVIADPESEVCASLRAYRASLPEELVPFIDKSRRTVPRWYYAIVSSQLDADRLDYLARDGYMAGIQTHQFDARRLISCLGIRDNRLVVDARARDVLENYLLALDQMYQSVYYHHAARASSTLLGAIIRRAIDVAREGAAVESIFPSVAGRREPLWALLCDGKRIPLSEYARLDEAHLWGLIRYWRDSRDTVLRDLCNRLSTRSFPKALDFGGLDDAAKERLQREAEAAWHACRPDLDARYYVEIDEPGRIGYKRYRSGEGSAESIMVLGREGSVQPIEALPRSIVGVLESKFVAQRLIVPREIADRARALIHELGRRRGP